VSHPAKPELFELTGSGEEVTVTVFEGGVPVRAVTASRQTVADAMALLPRMREMLDAGPQSPRRNLKLVKGDAK
jgi:hypothetical protein